MTSAPSADLSTQPALRLDDVTLRYPRGDIALDGVSLCVQPGERVGLVGSSGAGKSSLINLLNGRVLDEGAAVSGHVEVLGADPFSLRRRARRLHSRRIGTVRQAFDLVGAMRVVHNVNAGRLASWPTSRALWSLVRPSGVEEVGDALELVGLARELVDARVDQLSGGQQQRVAIARLLVQWPTLTLADEPVSSLDPESSATVLDLLSDPPGGRAWTLVISVHQPDLARRYVDRMVGLRDGRIEFDEPVDEVDGPRLAALYMR